MKTNKLSVTSSSSIPANDPDHLTVIEFKDRFPNHFKTFSPLFQISKNSLNSFLFLLPSTPFQISTPNSKFSKMSRRTSLPTSPITITVSPQSKKTASRSIGITSPHPRRCTLSPNQQNIPEESIHYTVHIPPTPERSINSSQKNSFLSSTIFTGGFNSVTKNRILESSDNGSVKKSSGMYCQMNGCDGEALVSKMPCECGFRVCKDCYKECLQNHEQCPGCKESYTKEEDDEEEEEDDEFVPLNSVVEFGGGGRRRSMVRSTTNDFDHNRWLFETKGTYGYGNALWPKDSNVHEQPDFGGLCKRPLTRKISVSQAILSPYRLLIAIRLVALGFFLAWRIRNPNREAMYLWGLSTVCELWFAFSWILDQLPKLCPVNRATDLSVLKERFETPNARNLKGRSDLPSIDVFVSTCDPEKEPPLVTCNTVLSILAADYPVEKLACYLSDDGGSLLTFEALAEAASFAKIWVPFCRKHGIEPRNPEAYFGQKRDFLKNKVRVDFVRERRKVKREYDEFKVMINSLPDSIKRRSDACNAHEEMRRKKKKIDEEIVEEEEVKAPKATWMSDRSHWPGTWFSSQPDHARGDHAGIIQVMLAPPRSEPVTNTEPTNTDIINTEGTDIRLPMLVYVSREKRPGFDHNKKAGAMNALVRSSAIMSNAPFILNLDCDHYIYNSLALREGMCFMLDRGGDRICFVQFPQRFEGIDPNDRYANHNLVFFDVTMRAMDGLQGPMYVGTGCIFRRTALYGLSPPRTTEHRGWFGTKKFRNKKGNKEEDNVLLPKRFGNSTTLAASIPVAEYQGRLLLDTPGVGEGRPAGALAVPREPLDPSTVVEAISVISCCYEDRTEWGTRVGWIYGSVTEDVVTGYRMHNRGWRSVYCVTKRDAFRGTAPINLTDRLHQVLRWATGSVEIFFSKNNAIMASPRMKFLQRVAYFNTGMYPFTSVFLIVYCVLPAVSLFTGEFIVNGLDITFLSLLLTITVTLSLLAVLEIRWSGITFNEWWRNEQFWVIGGTSAHPAAVVQGILKVVAGVDINFTLTSKPGSEDNDEETYAELYIFKWSFLMVMPITIMMVNMIAIGVGVCRELYSVYPRWSKVVGGVFFSFWVLVHLYPFGKGLMGKRGKVPTIVFVWSGLISIVVSLLWVYIWPPAGTKQYMLNV